eukprot:s3136_g9.t1
MLQSDHALLGWLTRDMIFQGDQPRGQAQLQPSPRPFKSQSQGFSRVVTPYQSKSHSAFDRAALFHKVSLNLIHGHDLGILGAVRLGMAQLCKAVHTAMR